MNTEKNSNQFEDDEISLNEIIIKIKNFIILLKSKWKSTIFIMLIGGLIGLISSFLIKPTYKANLTFAMEEDKGSGGSGLSGALGLASSFGIDLGGAGGGGAFAASNLAELMKSRLIVEKVLLGPIKLKDKTVSLLDYYIEFNEYKKKWRGKSNLENLNYTLGSNREKFTIIQDSILKEIYLELIEKENLSISQKDKKVTILTIEVSSKDELFSKTFCEDIAKETSNFYIETKSKKAKINVDVLQKQVDSVRNELNGAISNVAKEVDNVYNLNPALNKKGTLSKRKQIDVQANTAILTNLIIQLELAKINLRKETPLIQLIDRPIFPLKKNSLNKLNSFIILSLVAGLLYIFFIAINEFIKNITKK